MAAATQEAASVPKVIHDASTRVGNPPGLHWSVDRTDSRFFPQDDALHVDVPVGSNRHGTPDTKPSSVLRGTPKAPDNSALWAFALPFGLSAFGATAAALLNPRDRWGAAKKGALLGIAGLSACGPNAAETAPMASEIQHLDRATSEQAIKDQLPWFKLMPGSQTSTLVPETVKMIGDSNVETFALKEGNSLVGDAVGFCTLEFKVGSFPKNEQDVCMVTRNNNGILSVNLLIDHYDNNNRFDGYTLQKRDSKGVLDYAGTLMITKNDNDTVKATIERDGKTYQLVMFSSNSTEQVAPTEIPPGAFGVIYKAGLAAPAIEAIATVAPTATEIPSTPTETPIPEPKEGDWKIEKLLNGESVKVYWFDLKDADGNSIGLKRFYNLTSSYPFYWNDGKYYKVFPVNMFMEWSPDGDNPIKAINITPGRTDNKTTSYDTPALGLLEIRIKKDSGITDIEKYRSGVQDNDPTSAILKYTLGSGKDIKEFTLAPNQKTGMDVFILRNDPNLVGAHGFVPATVNSKYPIWTANWGNTKADESVRTIIVSERPLNELTDKEWVEFLLMNATSLLTQTDQTEAFTSASGTFANLILKDPNPFVQIIRVSPAVSPTSTP